MNVRVNPKTSAVSGIVGLVATAALVLSCSASSGNQQSDLNNIHPKYPDYVKMIMNVDQHPTAVMECIDGQGIITTSRDNSAAALQLVNEWNPFCRTQIGSKFSITGNESDEPAFPKGLPQS